MAVISKSSGIKPNATTSTRPAEQCNICGGSTGDFRAVVSDGQFYPRVCGSCRGGTNLAPTDAKYNKARAQEDFAKETLQPYVGGKVNPDFVTAYPDLKGMFTPEELETI